MRMERRMIDQSTMKFLSEASGDNGTEWLTDNEARKDCARRNLMEFTSQLIASAGLVDPRIAKANIDPRKCLARAPISRGVGVDRHASSPIEKRCCNLLHADFTRLFV
jgi:hypothetical protein